MKTQTADTSAERVLAFVASAQEIIAARLVTDLQAAPAQAMEVARDCAHDICLAHGGSFMYVPKDAAFDLTKRDWEIYHRFNGRNLHVLVKDYGVTHTRIYQIVARCKREMIAKTQHRLPGLED
jgi:Mor family transcriptional regulator